MCWYSFFRLINIVKVEYPSYKISGEGGGGGGGLRGRGEGGGSLTLG